ncbi:LYR motif-containing protein [Fusarium napiforme]|uniref:LYR motif-containing protein 2 n=1 Tax=Fusarium napiforme TaxID=42672 RepID=A0A8H5MKZ2_9HYPO|nr:LYR motif-containing protein [Fusarium napiforme]
MGLSIRLLTFSRGYATRSGGSRIKPTLSLDQNRIQFIQRGRVLAFYRTILRGTKKIADPTTRAESRKYARDEFERRRNVTDASHVRYLLSIGKTEWEGMERYIDVLALSPSSQIP